MTINIRFEIEMAKIETIIIYQMNGELLSHNHFLFSFSTFVSFSPNLSVRIHRRLHCLEDKDLNLTHHMHLDMLKAALKFTTYL